MTTATATRRCVECANGFEFTPAKGDGLAARMANATRRTCDSCIDRLERQEREAEAHARCQRHLDASGLPRRFRGLSFDDFEIGGNTSAFAAAREWADGKLDGLMLFGPLGVGKTTLAAAAINVRLQRQPVQWASVPSLIAESFGDQQAKERAARILTGSRPLVLDDLDKVKPNEWVASQLFAAIDNRLTAGTGLLVTTNLRNSEIAATFGEAIASRLKGYCALREMTGPDRRLT